MKKNKSEIFFDKIAKFYDDLTLDGVDRWTPPKLIQHEIDDLTYQNIKILDIGIGTGQSIEKIYKEKSFSKITGVDISSEMIKVCQNKYPEIELIKIDDLDDLEEINEKYDLIICSGAFEFFEDTEVFFKNCTRLINTGGSIVFTYEPIILFHKIQAKEISENVSGNTDYRVSGFFTKRYHPREIEENLIKCKFNVIKDIEFVSYKKNNWNIIYHLIVAIKND